MLTYSYLQFAVRIPVVSLNDEGRVVILPEDEKEQKTGEEPVNKEK